MISAQLTVQDLKMNRDNLFSQEHTAEIIETLVDEIRKDLTRTVDDLKQVAEDIDKWLEL